MSGINRSMAKSQEQAIHFGLAQMDTAGLRRLVAHKGPMLLDGSILDSDNRGIG